MKPNIELSIEELVLHGFAPADRYRIGEAVQHELERLLTERGIPPALLEVGDLHQLELGSIQVSQGARVGTIGQQVAWALYGGLSTGVERGRMPTAGKAPPGSVGQSARVQGKGEDT